MAYEQIDYEPEAVLPPEPFASLIKDADQRWGDFWAKGLNKRYPRYIASEPAQVYAALKYVKDHDLALGDQLIEWGSGFGVATNLAALMGYNATGIELQEGLVLIADELAEAHGTEAIFLNCSYIPEGFVEYDTIGGSDVIADQPIDPDNLPAYDGMDFPIEEIDVFFVYPWPGEQEMMLKLFDTLAGPDAILIAYFGDMEIGIYRKLAD